MSETLTYTRSGDYLLPDLIPDGPPADTAAHGKYARMRKAYLKEHRTITYNAMLLKGELYPNLREVQETAEERLARAMEALTEQSSLPDKAADPLGWAAAMNALRARTEEMILNELIYT